MEKTARAVPRKRKCSNTDWGQDSLRSWRIALRLSFEEIPEKVIKTAIYHESDAEKFIYPILKQLNSKFKIKLSGKNWVDICDLKTNKGIALKVISERFNISLNEVLAFGDFKNDTDMLMMTKYSVAMENAHDSIKAICNFETLSNDNNGVEYVLKKLISQKEQIL